MEITLTPQARTHVPAKPWNAAAYMIQTIELPSGTIDTMDTRIAILNPRNLKALNEAALDGKPILHLDAPATARASVGVETLSAADPTRTSKRPKSTEA